MPMGYLSALRLHNPQSSKNDIGKYTWISSSSRNVTNKNRDGENPIAIHYPEDYKDYNKIGLCEGLEFKGAIAANKLGYPVISFGGCNFGGSPKTLNKAIATIRENLWIQEQKKQSLKRSTLPLYASNTTKTVTEKSISDNTNVPLKSCDPSGEKLSINIPNGKLNGNLAAKNTSGSSQHPINFVLLCDAGCVSNKQVFQGYASVISLLKKWNYETKVAWWGQTDKKLHQDIDELESLENIELISPERFLSFGQTKQQKQSFVGFLKKYVPSHLRKRLCKTEEKIIRLGQDELPKLGQDEPVKIIYQPGQRLEAIKALQNNGWQNIIDTSIPGTGKSHDMGLMTNRFGKVWFANKEHRNPTTENVERNFKDLPTRHNGLVYDDSRHTPLGQPFQRTTNNWKEADIPGLCKHSSLFHTLAAKGYEPKAEDEPTNPICANCVHFTEKRKTEDGRVLPKCGATTGNGYGYLHARGKGILKNQISCSINSLPSPEDHTYKSDILMIDEADTEVEGIRSLPVSIKDIDKALMRLSKQFPLIFLQVRELIDKIYCYLDGSKPSGYYGLEREDIFKILGELPENIEEIVAACDVSTAKVSELVTPRDYLDPKGFGRKERRLAYAANEEFRHQAEQETKRKISQLEPNWLTDFFAIWAAKIPGSVRVKGDKLIVTTRADRHGSVARETGLTYLADATANKDILAYKLGIHPNSIIEIQQENPDFSNLTVHAIQTTGLSSNRPTELAVSRVKKILDSLNQQHGLMPIVAHKIMGFEHYWFNDTRGQNYFAGEKNLTIVGTPRLNMGAARDEYFTLHGTYEGFKDYYRCLTEAEQLQAIFRQRSHRYPETQFNLFYIGTNLDLQFLEEMGIRVVYHPATEICLEAGTKGEVTKFMVGNAIRQIVRMGDRNITQTRIAQMIGKCQQTVSLYLSTLGESWVSFKNKIQDLLLKGCYSEISKIVDQEINAWIERNPEMATLRVVNKLLSLSWREFQLFMAGFCLDTQARLLGLLLNIVLNEEEKNELLDNLSPPKPT